MDTQLKILKYPIENYSSKLWYPIENADTQFTKKVVGIYPMYSNPYLELWNYHTFPTLSFCLEKQHCEQNIWRTAWARIMVSGIQFGYHDVNHLINIS